MLVRVMPVRVDKHRLLVLLGLRRGLVDPRRGDNGGGGVDHSGLRVGCRLAAFALG